MAGVLPDVRWRMPLCAARDACSAVGGPVPDRRVSLPRARGLHRRWEDVSIRRSIESRGSFFVDRHRLRAGSDRHWVFPQSCSAWKCSANHSSFGHMTLAEFTAMCDVTLRVASAVER